MRHRRWLAERIKKVRLARLAALGAAAAVLYFAGAVYFAQRREGRFGFGLDSKMLPWRASGSCRRPARRATFSISTGMAACSFIISGRA